jgi:hypothetical protein
VVVAGCRAQDQVGPLSLWLEKEGAAQISCRSCTVLAGAGLVTWSGHYRQFLQEASSPTGLCAVFSLAGLISNQPTLPP